jgi:hypothetical protein
VGIEEGEKGTGGRRRRRRRGVREMEDGRKEGK